jgi:hypothetical protein
MITNKYTLEEYIKFISEFVPHFDKLENNYRMFTVPTQWMEDDSIIKLLDYGIKVSRENNGKSPWIAFMDKVNDKI